MFTPKELNVIKRTPEMQLELDQGIDTAVDGVNITQLCFKIEGLKNKEQ